MRKKMGMGRPGSCGLALSLSDTLLPGLDAEAAAVSDGLLAGILLPEFQRKEGKP